MIITVNGTHQSHYMNMSVESYIESHGPSPAEMVEMGWRNRQLTAYWEPWQGAKGLSFR